MSDGEKKKFSIRNGKDFTIVHRFSTIKEMEDSEGHYIDETGETVDFEINDFVLIDSDVEKEENSRLYYYLGEGLWKFTGDVSGCKGDTGTIEIGTVETGDEASVENVGTPQSAVLNFTLPKGDKGDRSTIAIGQVSIVDGLTNAEIENTGDENDAVLDFRFPSSFGGNVQTVNDVAPNENKNILLSKIITEDEKCFVEVAKNDTGYIATLAVNNSVVTLSEDSTGKGKLEIKLKDSKGTKATITAKASDGSIAVTGSSLKFNDKKIPTMDFDGTTLTIDL